MSIEALNWARRVGAAGVLRPAEILLLWQLADSADQRDWSCWPSQKTLARETNQSLRTVNEQIRRLKGLGLIQVEDRRGKGGGRIGLIYYLIEESLEHLVPPQDTKSEGPGSLKDDAGSILDEVTDEISSTEYLNANPASRTNSRHANTASRTDSRHADSAFESENRENMRHANTAFGQPKRKLASNPNANSRKSEQVPLKDHARINHHHHPSDAREAMTDDDDDQQLYRRVDLARLFQQVPGLSGYADEPDLVRETVDVVLNRASGRIANPTAYVRTALSQDLYGVIGSALSTTKSSASSQTWPSGALGGPVEVLGSSDIDDARQATPSLDDQGDVPELSDLADDAVPCTNLEHLQSYEPSARQLAHCNHCRLDPLDANEDNRHVLNITGDQIAALPNRLQRWVKQFQSGDAVGALGIENSVH